MRARLVTAFAALAVLVGLGGVGADARTIETRALGTTVARLATGATGVPIQATRISPNALDAQDAAAFARATGLALDVFALARADAADAFDRYAFAVRGANLVVIGMPVDAADIRGEWRVWYLQSVDGPVRDTRVLSEQQVSRATAALDPRSPAEAVAPRRGNPVCTTTFGIASGVAGIALAFCPVSAGVGCAIAGGAVGVATIYGAVECNKYADPAQYSVVELPPWHGYCSYSGCLLDFISTNPSAVIRIGGRLDYWFNDVSNGNWYRKFYPQPEDEPTAVSPLGSTFRVNDHFGSGTFYGNCGARSVSMAYFLRFQNLSGVWYEPALYALQPETVC